MDYDRISGQCAVCSDSVIGIRVPYDDQAREHAFRAVSGHMCNSCQVLSCEGCKKEALGYKAISGFARAKCFSCGAPTESPFFVLGEVDQEQLKKSNRILEANNQPAETKPDKNRAIPGVIIGLSAAVLFLVLGGAPILKGGPEFVRWLGGGGFIYLLGAAALGVLAPRFIGK